MCECVCLVDTVGHTQWELSSYLFATDCVCIGEALYDAVGCHDLQQHVQVTRVEGVNVPRGGLVVVVRLVSKQHALLDDRGW